MISHKWINGKCECGCEVFKSGKARVMIKNGVMSKYFECTRPIPRGTSMYYHKAKEKYKTKYCGHLSL